MTGVWRRVVVILLFAVGAGCRKAPEAPVVASIPAPAHVVGLLDARHGFHTRLLTPPPAGPRTLPDDPPVGVYRLVKYPSPAGLLDAYVTPPPADGRKRPAVVWAHGGFGGIGAYYFSPQPASNDQTPRAFVDAGFVVMLPSWRGEHDNPGRFEMFYGEVDDALAAVEYVSKLPCVDPARVYIVGHGAGGTIALLAAEASDRLRAAFSFGGAPDVGRVVAGAKESGRPPFDYHDGRETGLRSAIQYVAALRTPTWYFEGANSAYAPDAIDMRRRAEEAHAPFNAFLVAGGAHFNILRPLTRMLAEKLAADTGPACNVRVTADEVAAAFDRQLAAKPSPAPLGLITLTPSAQAAARAAMLAKGLEPAAAYLRLSVAGDGFSLDFDRSADADDLFADCGGVRVVLDRRNAAMTKPFTVDFILHHGMRRFIMKDNRPATNEDAPAARP